MRHLTFCDMWPYKFDNLGMTHTQEKLEEYKRNFRNSHWKFSASKYSNHNFQFFT